MNKFLKNDKGVTLVTLAVTIVILVIVTNILVYNAKDNVYIKKLEGMYNDISNLRDKVSTYYVKYGNLPILKDSSTTEKNPIEYSSITKGDTDLNKIGSVVGNADSGKFYVIDLNAFDNLTLNNGKDFDTIKTNNSIDTEHLDFYIINETSHNIFYVKGVEVSGKTYFTDEKKDDTVADLKYVDGIKLSLIPIGPTSEFNEKVGDTKANLTLKKTTNSHYYKWRTIENNITALPEGVHVNDEYEFIESVNANKGFFADTTDFDNSTPNVWYLPLDSQQWTTPASSSYTYTDKNGDSAYIPEGFSLSMTPNMNTVYRGLVVKDENDNEYVWINVPKSVTQNANSEEEIETALKEYASDYRQDGYEDVWYDSTGKTVNDVGYNASDTGGCGLTLSDYDTLKKAMLNSIKNHGGFYIGRYEAGDETTTNAGTTGRTQTTGTTETLVSKPNMYPYNYITCSQAQQLAKKAVNDSSLNSSLMFGIQWDLVCKFIETSGSKIKDEIKTDSTSWGNYSNAIFNIYRGGYSIDDGATWTKLATGESYSKLANSSRFLTTGSSERNYTNNIYDLAGNTWAWTLEKSPNKWTFRSGDYNNNVGNTAPMSSRQNGVSLGAYTQYYDLTFRVSIY